jgi:hypothetical protein
LSGIAGLLPQASATFSKARLSVELAVFERDHGHFTYELAMCYKSADVRLKLRYTIPLAQMALALVLLRLSYLEDVWQHRAGCHMCGPGPAFHLLISINVPVAVARAFWWRALYSASEGFGPMIAYLLDGGTQVVAIGLLWYGVMLNVCSLQQGRMVLMFRWLPLRIAGNVILAATGMFWALYCVANDLLGWNLWNLAPIVPRPEPSVYSFLWFIVLVGLHLTWSLALIYFFGRDLALALSRQPEITT